MSRVEATEYLGNKRSLADSNSKTLTLSRIRATVDYSAKKHANPQNTDCIRDS